ncbi:MAG: hypothetical protein RL043_641 [Pseudomonadota bacterium]|jgi:peroxiredoxin
MTMRSKKLPRTARRNALQIALALSLLPFGQAALAVSAGQPAPSIALQTLEGKPVGSSDLKNKWLVLEWTNPGCPFVQKHYQAGNMQATQAAALKAGFTWVQINSTNPSHQDYKAPKDMAAWNSQMKAQVSLATLDPNGATGKAFGAKTTPQMVIINPQGTVVYNGAIDSIRSANQADISKATNYVLKAVAEIKTGKPVSEPETTPYGCSIKY